MTEDAIKVVPDTEKQSSIDDDPDKEPGIDEEGVSGGASAAKTPVSLLQELYVRRGLTPKYDLVQGC
jgi:hypothetical protein